jgi:signal transduction histidine kinase
VLSRLRSFRLQLLAATAVTAVIGLLGANLAVTALQTRDNHASDRHEARLVADRLASELAHDASLAQVRLAQDLLADDQVVVFRKGRRVFAGPPLRATEVEAVERASFPGGSVVVRRHESATHDSSPRAITLIFAIVVVLVIAAAALVSTVLARRVRRPLEQAIAVADRVAAGDYSARLGPSGLEEFAHFGRAFDAMAERLEQSDLEQRRFLADVAHELANPINALVGFATALADGTAETPDEQAEAAVTIAQESARLRTLLQDLRDLTRVDLFESVRAEPLRLDRFGAEIAGRMRPLLDQAQLELDLRLEPVETVADPRVLESVVRNLLSNAIQYTPAGGTVTVWTGRRGANDVLGVRDTGIGIPPEHRARVFDRLYRADEARDRASGGSGLGLAIAPRAAAALGGRLELDSEPGRGSEFRLLLPRSGHRLYRAIAERLPSPQAGRR